ncbi:MAG TPA: Ig-like domain-containing protein [Gemmatimonadales bacterium]|nr:Ig-like domain-containing protein [Gemmatimonadales bacterium]
MRGRWMFWGGVIMLVTACGGDMADESGDRVVTEPAGVLLSSPIPRRLSTADAAGSLVFVAATPGFRPAASTATLRNLRTGAVQAVTLRDGGFDPVSLEAEEADTVEVSIAGGTSAPTTETALVARGKPPRVVRSSPQPRQTDVPLNVRIEVVLSAPVDASTLEGEVRLLRGEVPVPGTVLLTPDRLTVGFAPAEPLVASADYTLVLGSGVADVLGTLLEGAVAVPFQTASSPVQPDPTAGVTSLPAGRLVFQSADGIWAVDTDGRNLLRLTESGRFPTVAGDGRLAFVDGHDLRLRDTDGSMRAVFEGGDAWLWCPVFVNDGNRIVVARFWESDVSRRSELLVLSLESGETRTLVSKDWYPHGNQPASIWGADEVCGHPSPDGTLVAYVGGDGNDTWVIGIDGTGARQVADGYGAGPWSPDGSTLALVRWHPYDLARRPPSALVRVTDGRIIAGYSDFVYPGAHAWAPNGDGVVLPWGAGAIGFLSTKGALAAYTVRPFPIAVSFTNVGYVPPSAARALGGQ